MGREEHIVWDCGSPVSPFIFNPLLVTNSESGAKARCEMTTGGMEVLGMGANSESYRREHFWWSRLSFDSLTPREGLR